MVIDCYQLNSYGVRGSKPARSFSARGIPATLQARTFAAWSVSGPIIGAMNWVETVWIGMCAASLALGAIHLFVWFKQKTGYAHLLFFALAVSATAFGAFELAMMRSLSPTSYASALRWAHVPLAMFVLSIVWFVYFHFGA